MGYISDEEELADAAATASEALQDIQTYLGSTPHPAGRVRFPRGFLPTATAGRRRVSFIQGEVLRTNVSYALMLAAVQRWILHRTDLAATAQEMVVKTGLAAYGSILEGVLRDFTRDALGGRQSVGGRLRLLRQLEVIDDALRDELLWLWEQRNKQHLFELSSREINHYSPTHFDRAEVAIESLLERLAHATRPASPADASARR